MAQQIYDAHMRIVESKEKGQQRAQDDSLLHFVILSTLIVILSVVKDLKRAID